MNNELCAAEPVRTIGLNEKELTEELMMIKQTTSILANTIKGAAMGPEQEMPKPMHLLDHTCINLDLAKEIRSKLDEIANVLGVV